jgi:hypothetical protein
MGAVSGEPLLHEDGLPDVRLDDPGQADRRCYEQLEAEFVERRQA